MRSKIFKPLIFLLSLLVAGGVRATATVLAPDQEFTKTINREFATIAEGTTALYNKYGKVTVNTWQNNSVKIDITIIVVANSQSAADKTFERINVNFTNTPGYVKAETMIADKNSGWSISNLVSWNNNSCEDFKINYTVWMPQSNQLDLKNRYGNSTIGQINGKVWAEIKYGDLRADGINNACELWLGYGKANIQSVQNLNADVSYSGLNVVKARDVEMKTKYSEIEFDEANEMKLESRYDNFSFVSVGNLKVNTLYSEFSVKNAKSIIFTSQYADLKIGSIATVLDADMTYGSLAIQNLNRNFTEVRLNGKYTDFRLEVERGAAFRFDAEGSYAGLKYPSGATVRSNVEKSSWRSVSGYVGEENAKGLVKARLSYGDFVLR